MGAFALLGFGAFVAVSLSVGLRLLLLARRTREVPELAIGGALFAGGLGYCGFISAFALRALPDLAVRPVHAIAAGGLDIGILALVLGVWRVFRPGSRVAAGGFIATAAALTLHFAASLASFDPSGHRTPFVFWLFNAVGASAYGWSAFECFRYHGLLRRRARLGLVDDDLVNRFLLWALAGSCGFLLFAVGMLNRIAANGGVHTAVLLSQSILGLGAGVCIWLAFFPPAFYVRRIAGEVS